MGQLQSMYTEYRRLWVQVQVWAMDIFNWQVWNSRLSLKKTVNSCFWGEGLVSMDFVGKQKSQIATFKCTCHVLHTAFWNS